MYGNLGSHSRRFIARGHNTGTRKWFLGEHLATEMVRRRRKKTQTTTKKNHTNMEHLCPGNGEIFPLSFELSFPFVSSLSPGPTHSEQFSSLNPFFWVVPSCTCFIFASCDFSLTLFFSPLFLFMLSCLFDVIFLLILCAGHIRV